MHALGTERLGREGGGDCGVDPAGDSNDDVGEAVLADVVVQPELERQSHLLELGQDRRKGGAALVPRFPRRLELDDERLRQPVALARERATANIA